MFPMRMVPLGKHQCDGLTRKIMAFDGHMPRNIYIYNEHELTTLI